MAKQQEPALRLSVKIFSPQEVYYDGVADSLSAKNATGQFDILPLHHNFITLLSAGTVTVGIEKDRQKTIDIEKGLLHVRDNTAIIFLDV